MLQLNIEYTYREICEVLNWNITTGSAKQKQIKAIEDAYEFYHPENKKTHKPKKSYIFTNKLKEIELIDGRKNNGGNNSSYISLFPHNEFDYLFNYMLSNSQRYQSCNYYRYDLPDSAYLTTGIIYKNFGFDIYKILNSIEYKEINNKVSMLFKTICIDTVKSFTITRICKKLGYNKNSLPKGILRKASKRSEKEIIDDKLLERYNRYEKEVLRILKFKNISEAITKEKYSDIVEAVQRRFEESNIYGIKKTNVINYNHANIEIKYNSKKRKEYQNHLRKVILMSIKNTINKRVHNLKEYRNPLNGKEKYLMSKYYTQLLDICLSNDYKYINDEQYEELKDGIGCIREDKFINEEYSNVISYNFM